MRDLSLAGEAERQVWRIDGLHRWLLAPSAAAGDARPRLLKQLVPTFARDTRLVERWLEIAAHNANLQHAGCARVVDWGAHGEGVFLVSELAPGLSLQSLLRAASHERGRLQPQLAVHVACSVLAALSHAQQSDPSLTHLDLDPAGLHVGLSGELTLSEFGLWSVLSPARLARCRFDSGRVRYSSPELVQARPTDTRSDIFSVGTLLFELLTGERPFMGATQLVIAMAIAEGERKSIHELDPTAPSALRAIVDSMLEVDREARFQSPQAAKSALESTLTSGSDELKAALATHARAALTRDPSAALGVRPTSPGAAATELPPERRSAPATAPATRSYARRGSELHASRPSTAGALPRGARPEEHLRPATRASAGEPARSRLDGAPRPVDGPLPPPLVLPAKVSLEPAQRPQAAAVEPALLVAHPAPAGQRHGAPSLLNAPIAPDGVHDGRTTHLQPGRALQPSAYAATPESAAAPRAPSPLPPLRALDVLDVPGALGPGESALPPLPEAALHDCLRLSPLAAERAGASASPPWPPAARVERWQEPSLTLFQRKRPARGTTEVARSFSVSVVLLVALLGFAAVVISYLLYRLWS